MNKVDEAILSLKNGLDNNELIKEYKQLKTAIDNSNELLDLQNAILEYNKKNEIKKMNELKAIYESHPLIVNFYNIKDEVNTLLNEIKGELENI